MRVRDIGERELISIIHRLQATPPIGFIGIGDDAAYLPPSANGWLVSQDMLVENVHFRWDWMTPAQLGEKAVAVNVSDIAAMGGQPVGILTSVSLPSYFDVQAVEDLYRGMAKALDSYGAVLLGGDTVGSEDRLVLDITVLGRPGAHGPVTRNGARPGDRLYVTGRLGASHAGMTLLSHGVSWPGTQMYERSALFAHIAPRARVEGGQRLGLYAHALIDVSDGLYTELVELTRFGGVGARIDAARLPIDPATRKVAKRYAGNPIDYALYGGEDYELLAAVPPSRVKDVEKACDDCGVVITEIGVVTDEPGIFLVTDEGAVLLDGEKEFNHFAVDNSPK